MSSIHIGGQVDGNKASFRLWHEVLDPEEVSAALGLMPSHSFKRGDSTPSTHRKLNLGQRRGMWQLTNTLPREAPLDRHLRHLLDQLHPNADRINEFIRIGYDAQFFCGLFLDRWNRGTKLLPSTMARIAELGATLDLDIYGPDGPVDVVEDDDEAG